MEPNEVEFLAEKEMISIVPNFSQDKIFLIGVCTGRGSLQNIQGHRVTSDHDRTLILTLNLTITLSLNPKAVTLGQDLNPARPSKTQPPQPNYRPGRAAINSKGPEA